MIMQPLHPVVVHFPIVFVVLLPIAAIVAIFAIRRGAALRSAWLPVTGIAAALALSSWLAVETGEREEEIVEQVVAESAIHDHEESAEIFFPLTVAGLLLVSAGLLNGRPGRLLRSMAETKRKITARTRGIRGPPENSESMTQHLRQMPDIHNKSPRSGV